MLIESVGIFIGWGWPGEGGRGNLKTLVAFQTSKHEIDHKKLRFFPHRKLHNRNKDIKRQRQIICSSHFYYLLFPLFFLPVIEAEI
jgi:hypothetical protein